MRRNVELTSEQQRALRDVAEAAGRSEEEVLQAALASRLAELSRVALEGGIHLDQMARMLLRKWLDESGPAVRSTPNVVGGDACIRNTRIPIWTLVDYRRQGLTDAQILEAFPVLNIADLAAAWDFYVAHGDEVDAQRKRHEDAA